MLGPHSFLRAAIPEAELVALDLGFVDGNDQQGLAADAFSALPGHDQQLALSHFGGAVVLLGQARYEVEVRLVALVDALNLGGHRAHRLPAVALGHIVDDL